jgi:hypothetical protein
MIDCREGKCLVPIWMKLVLLLAGCYCFGFATVCIFWPAETFAMSGLIASGHLTLVQIIGILYAVFGCGFFMAAHHPMKHWRIVLLSTIKILLVLVAAIYSWWNSMLTTKLILLLTLDDLLWLIPFLMILWSTLQAHLGISPIYHRPLPITEAATNYTLSSGETLAEASQAQEVVLVFLRHFGCTFTRQLLRGLEILESQASHRQARLVLVHMLQSGKELAYLGDRTCIARIADPYCELYRSFGLGKAGFWDLFGPRVLLRGLIALIRGCGVGSIAGDGLQMPGAFLFYQNTIISAQPAHSAADLPDLEKLFEKHIMEAGMSERERM